MGVDLIYFVHPFYSRNMEIRFDNRGLFQLISKFILWRRLLTKTFANVLFYHFISKYGAPVKLIGDNHLIFASDIFKELWIKLGIRNIFTISNLTQCNMAGRIIRTIIQMVSPYIGSHYGKLDHFLQHFAYSLHTAVLESAAELFLRKKSPPLSRV